MKTPTSAKVSSRRIASAFIAVLVSGGAAFAAEPVDNAQAQAVALLAATPANRTNGVSGALPPASSDAESQDQVRALLERPRRLTPAQRLQQSTGNLALPAADHGDAYAGAQESARRMILGRGA